MKEFLKKFKKPLIVAGVVITLSSVSLALIRQKKKEMQFADKLIANAKKYIGFQGKEKKVGFKDADFEKKMKNVGWSSGNDWCDFFVKMNFMEICTGKAKEYFKKALTGGTQRDFQTFKTKNKFCKIKKKPQRGDLVFYQNTSNNSFGHVEIVTNVNKDGSFEVISGNSNNMVQVKTRPKNGIDGKVILGFVRLKRID